MEEDWQSSEIHAILRFNQLRREQLVLWCSLLLFPDAVRTLVLSRQFQVLFGRRQVFPDVLKKELTQPG